MTSSNYPHRPRLLILAHGGRGINMYILRGHRHQFIRLSKRRDTVPRGLWHRPHPRLSPCRTHAEPAPLAEGSTSLVSPLGDRQAPSEEARELENITYDLEQARRIRG